MKFITYEQYIKYRYSNNLEGVREDGIEYNIFGIEENKYDEKKLNEIDKKHDKMFRNILSRKKEMIKFLWQFLELEKEIKEEQIIQCPTDFITRRYKSKQPDIVYRLKNKPVYFLIEHQSTVDKDMPLRIFEYIGEIVRKDKVMHKNNYIKERLYPIVVPIVIYTGIRKWNAKTNFAHKQYQEKEYKEFENNLEYNLIDVKEYTFEELLKKKSLLGSIMIMEKCTNKDELVTQIYKIIETIESPEDKEVLSEVIDNVITPLVGAKVANEMLEKINEKEAVCMSPLTKMLLDLEIKGKKEGMKEGMKKERNETVKNMLRLGETEEKIMKYIGISKEELENIKEMVTN